MNRCCRIWPAESDRPRAADCNSATGLSEVRIEPAVIANETDPSARLTVGQDLTDQLKLVYSTNLTDSNDQIWIAEYDVTRRFQARGVRQSDTTFRVDFRTTSASAASHHRGDAPQRPKVASVVVVSADTGQDESARFATSSTSRKGTPSDFFVIRDETATRVEEVLMKQGFLQSRIRLERKVEGDQLTDAARVKRGPRVDIHFIGAEAAAIGSGRGAQQWHRGVFDKQRADERPRHSASGSWPTTTCRPRSNIGSRTRAGHRRVPW